MTTIHKTGSIAGGAVISQSGTSDIDVKKTEGTEPAPVGVVQQDAKTRVAESRLAGQMREASLRSQLETKMPETRLSPENKEFLENKDAGINTPDGFKSFDDPPPSIDLQWPAKGDWHQTKASDGSVHRTLKDEAGNQWNERIDKAGNRERERLGIDGTRQFEILGHSGDKVQGGTDKNGNSYTIDSHGQKTRMHQEASGKLYSETIDTDGTRSRRMQDKDGSYWNEKLEPDGKVEREQGDAKGNRRMEIRSPDGFSVKALADDKGDSWSKDSNGFATRMHQDKSGKLYMETIDPEGNKTTRMSNKNGSYWEERISKDGKIERETGIHNGTRQMEMIDSSSGYAIRGANDGKGNSWSIDSNGTSVSMHQDKSGNVYSETINKDGSIQRQKSDSRGNQTSVTLDRNGKVIQ